VSDTDRNERETKGNPQEAMTVKGISADRRKAILAAAKRMDMTLGEFVLAACEAKIRETREPLGVSRSADAGNLGTLGETSDPPVRHHPSFRVLELSLCIDMIAKLSSVGGTLPADVAVPLYAAIRREFKLRTPRKALPAPEAA
jgi:hypothetical protein